MSYVALVDAAVRLNRALWQIRRELGVEEEKALRIRGPKKASKRLSFFLEERRKTLHLIRKTWPSLTESECLLLTKTVTQAASLALERALADERRLGPLTPPPCLCGFVADSLGQMRHHRRGCLIWKRRPKKH